MNSSPKLPAIAAALLFLGPLHAQSRIFTSSDGKIIEAEYLSSSESHVTLKLNRNGREYTIPIERLSNDDQQFVAELRASRETAAEAKAAADARAAEADAAAKKIAQFAQDNIGKTIGNGDCWTFANHAFIAAGVRRPGKATRVWGKEIDWREEKARPGDILELEKVVFASGIRTDGKHTAIIVGCKKKGVMTVCHQNQGGRKFVTTNVYDLNTVTSGTVKVYRYE